jgi:uncharacterized membrane protein
LILIVWGFAHYRAAGVIEIWTPPAWTRYATAALMWLAFVSLACMSPAPGSIRGWVRHPMLTAVTLWAAAHLFSNGDAGGLALFGSFFLWAIYDRISVTRRGDPGACGSHCFTKADATALTAGTLVYAALIFLHPFVTGFPVFGK